MEAESQAPVSADSAQSPAEMSTNEEATATLVPAPTSSEEPQCSQEAAATFVSAPTSSEEPQCSQEAAATLASEPTSCEEPNCSQEAAATLASALSSGEGPQCSQEGLSCSNGSAVWRRWRPLLPEARSTAWLAGCIKEEPVEVPTSETPIKVKEEPKGRRGFARSPKDHFRFQVSFVNKFVSTPWRQCFGGLGTGIVGVRPQDAEPVAKVPDSLPGDAVIIIFVNPPAFPLQKRGERFLGGFQETLDDAQRTLEWSSQRSDVYNKKLQAIVNHQSSGGRVVVGVRHPGDKEFRTLGDVTKISSVQEARFLVQDGDVLIKEKGTSNYHRVITPACLNDALERGVGLGPVRWSESSSDRPTWCRACCYAQSKALLHFDKMEDDGVGAFRFAASKGRSRTLKKEAEPECQIPPRKRARTKQPPSLGIPTEVSIKVEQVEDT